MEEHFDDLNAAVRIARNRSALDYVRQEPTLRSPEIEGEEAARRIIQKLDEDRSEARAKQRRHA